MYIYLLVAAATVFAYKTNAIHTAYDWCWYRHKARSPYNTWPYANHAYKVPYSLLGKTYAMIIVKKPQHPDHRLIDVLDDTKTSVLEPLKEFLGPNHDFNGLRYTPNLLGYTSLSFIFENMLQEETITFKNTDKIII